MKASPSCSWPDRDETVAQWTAGSLDPEASAAFESHLVACALCQGAVEELTAVRAALRRNRSRRPSRTHVAVWMAPAAIAAALVMLLVSQFGTDPLDRLGRIDSLPTFGGERLRGARDGLAGSADRGLEAYRDGRFDEAARLLGEASRAARSAGIDFYLGSSLLALDRPADALVALGRALDAPGVYGDEARLLIAKAHLQLRQPDSALAVLGRLSSDSPDALGRHARALRDSIREVIRP